MKKEQLLRKLENVELPDLVVESHKAKLRQVLLQGTPGKHRYLPSARGKAPWYEGIISWLKGPLWRPALASSLALILVGAVLGASLYLSSPSPAVLAADIVKKDPGIQQKLSGSGEIIIVRVEVRENMANVVCGRSVGDFIEADVDISGRAVVGTRRFEGLYIPEIPLEAQDNAVKIVRTDPAIRDKLDRGATIGRIFPVFSSISSISIINGSILKISPATTQAVVPVILDGKAWMVQVNLEHEKVEKIIEPQSRPSHYYDIYYFIKTT